MLVGHNKNGTVNTITIDIEEIIETNKKKHKKKGRKKGNTRYRREACLPCLHTAAAAAAAAAAITVLVMFAVPVIYYCLIVVISYRLILASFHRVVSQATRTGRSLYNSPTTLERQTTRRQHEAVVRRVLPHL